jgi:hypothetical protein
MNDVSVTVQFDDPRPVYYPGEILSGWYRLAADKPLEIREVELAILWHTEGKGNEDVGVHFFESQTPAEGQAIGAVRRFSTKLPRSPLSYDGLIVKIRWCVRVRALCRGGPDLVGEAPFQLGDVARPGDLPA